MLLLTTNVLLTICGFCFVLGQNISSNSSSTNSPSIKQPREYVLDIIEILDGKLRSYGLFNLPVHSYRQVLNRTVYGIDIIGVTRFSFGFVMSIDKLRHYDRHFVAGPFHGEISIESGIEIPNIAVIFDLAADLQVGNFVGTAKHVFPRNQLEIIIKRNFTSNDPEVSTRLKAVSSANVTEYFPNNTVTKALARIARLTTHTFIWEDIDRWIDGIIQPMLNEIVSQLPFPL